jgi:hypothetical protein
MFMPVAVTCLVSGSCFFWGGVVTESKEQCLKQVGAVEAVANKNKDVSAVQTDCLEVRFSYKDKKAVNYK